MHYVERKIDVIDCLCTSKVKVLKNPRTAWPVQVTEQPKLVLACGNYHSPKLPLGTFGSKHGPSRHLTWGLQEVSMVWEWAFPGQLVPVDEMMVLGTCDGLVQVWLPACEKLQVCLCSSCRSACPAPNLGSTGQHIWSDHHKRFVMWAQPCQPWFWVVS